MIERIPITDEAMWLGTRRHFLNASEMPIVCGVAHFASAAALYAEKVGLRPPQLDNAALRRGRWGEPSIFQALAETYPEWEIKRARIHCVDRERRIAATPDAFAATPSAHGIIMLLEGKVVARSIFRQKWLTDPFDPGSEPIVPMNYKIQVAATLALNPDCESAALAALIVSEFDWELKLFPLERDQKFEDFIMERAATFWRDYLDPGIMPPFEFPQDERLIKLLYPKDSGRTIDLTTDNRALQLVSDLEEVQAANKRLVSQERSIKAELGSKLGDNTYGRLADGRFLSWKTQHRKPYAVEATDFRVLRVLKSEPEESE